MVIFINKFCQVFICKYIFSKDFSFCFAKSPLESSEHKVNVQIGMGWRHFHHLPGEGGAWREYTPLEKIPCVVKLQFTPSPLKNAPYVVHPPLGFGSLRVCGHFQRGNCLEILSRKGVGVIDKYYVHKGSSSLGYKVERNVSVAVTAVTYFLCKGKRVFY